MTVTVAPVTGSALQDLLPALADLRIEVFRDYPYLYDGSHDYEQRYIADFAAAADTVVVVARDGNEIVGMATASPCRVMPMPSRSHSARAATTSAACSIAASGAAARLSGTRHRPRVLRPSRDAWSRAQALYPCDLLRRDPAARSPAPAGGLPATRRLLDEARLRASGRCLRALRLERHRQTRGGQKRDTILDQASLDRRLPQHRPRIWRFSLRASRLAITMCSDM